MGGDTIPSIATDRSAPAGRRSVSSGRFAKLDDWELGVTVEVRDDELSTPAPTLRIVIAIAARDLRCTALLDGSTA
ncbi:MAG: hypothetical protein IT384_32350 [Deltaproteobacteria bacterium]|nr:hypothetical protein [Deltaproteobacteria bacterium]